MYFKLIFLLIILPILLFCKEKKVHFLSYNARIEIQAINPEKVQDEIDEYLKKNDGYFISRSNYQMQLKIKPEKLLVFINFLKSKGLITQQEISNFNYQDRFNQYQVTIKTQEETLENILKIFDQAGLYEALAIEQKIQQIMNEIETAKGQVRYIEEHVQYAYVEILFKTYAALIKTESQSPFAWINELGLEKLFAGQRK